MSTYAPAAEAATKILEFLAESDSEVGISEISRGTEINKNMVFRILNSLEKEGWVYSADQKYSLTLLPFRLSSKAVSRMTLNNVSTPILLDLLNKTGESTYLGILSSDKVLYIQHFDGIKDVKVAGRIGGEYELYCSAPGKVLLAYTDSDFIEKYTSLEHEKRTENSITDKTLLLEELESVRKNGYSTDREEFGNGISCVAAPIFDYTGKVVGAVGCSAFTLNKKSDEVIERLLPTVKNAADEISKRLGA